MCAARYANVNFALSYRKVEQRLKHVCYIFKAYRKQPKPKGRRGINVSTIQKN